MQLKNKYFSSILLFFYVHVLACKTSVEEKGSDDIGKQLMLELVTWDKFKFCV